MDSLVTDPPAGISFMGKEWDSNKGGRREWINWLELVARECLRVMKPGAHGLVWALPRTSHWTATALEWAGFEIRDIVMHVFGQGFPKSHDVSKAIDRHLGDTDKRPVIGEWKPTGTARPKEGQKGHSAGRTSAADDSYSGQSGVVLPVTSAASAAWEGWGTALKPAAEHWILVRKPLAGTVAENVLAHGVGAINVAGSRIGDEPRTNASASASASAIFGSAMKKGPSSETIGRWPANVILSHDDECLGGEKPFCMADCPVEVLDGQSGRLASGPNPRRRGVDSGRNVLGKFDGQEECEAPRGSNSGGASRFFMVFPTECKPSSLALSVEGHSNPSAPEIVAALEAALTDLPQGGPQHGLETLRASTAEMLSELRQLNESNIGKIQSIAERCSRELLRIKNEGGNPARLAETRRLIDIMTIILGPSKFAGSADPATSSITSPSLEPGARGFERFRYVPKPTKHERDFGVLSEEKTAAERTGRRPGSAGINAYAGATGAARNAHPTVKPMRLMRYLVTMITPPGGRVLDCFMGSGTTGAVAVACGFQFVGIEQDVESFNTAKARIQSVKAQGPETPPAK